MTRTLRRGLLATLAAAVAVATPFAPTLPARASGGIVEYPTTGGSGPTGIAYSTADENLWATEASAQIARINDHAGHVGEVSQFGPLAFPGNGITRGPDGNMWFTETSGDRIGMITPAGTISEFLLPPGYRAFGITAAPDASQSLYFTDPSNNRIGRISTTGVATEPIAPLTPNAGLTHITSGTDGRLYWAENAAGKLGRSDLAGNVSEVALPAGAHPQGIVGLPDGSVWFADQAGRVGKLDAAFTPFVAGVAGAPEAIVLGADGGLWFTDTAGGKVWTINQLVDPGSLRSLGIPSGSTMPVGISAGANNTIWFSQKDRNLIGEFGLAVVASVSPALGPALGGTVVTISGSQFTGATAVRFGGASVACPSASCSVVDDSHIRVTTPPSSVGTVDVTVTTPINNSPPSPAAKFTFYAPGGNYVAITPYRVLDTRGSFSLGPNSTMDVQITGTGTVPASGVQAVAVNVTAVNATAASYLTVYPTGAATRPTASNLNFGPGQQIANLVFVAVGNGGKLTIYNSQGSVDVLMDVQGYVTSTPSGAAGLFNPLPGGPKRILDTRNGTGGYTQPLGPNSSISLQVGGGADVPAGATGIVLNLTAVSGTANSYLSVYPTGSPGLFSNLNFPAGRNLPNRVMSRLSSGGQVSIYNSEGRVDVVGDLVGYLSGGTGTGAYFHAQPPVRILDTRPPSQVGPYSTPFGPNQTRAVNAAGQAGVPLAGTAAVFANVTVTNPDTASFLTAFPGDASAPPLASDLNFLPAETIPNLVVVRVGAADGTMKIYNNLGYVDVLADLSGWIGPA